MTLVDALIREMLDGVESFGDALRSRMYSKPVAESEPLVRPMTESEARYLGLLYLEAQGWI